MKKESSFKNYNIKDLELLSSKLREKIQHYKDRIEQCEESLEDLHTIILDKINRLKND